MKKLISVVLMLCVLMTLSAGFDYRLDLLSFEPLHKEYMGDKNSANMQFNYIYNFAGFPDHIFQDSPSHNTGYVPQVFPVPGQRMVPWMGQFKAGETLGLLRNTFSFDNFLSPISFDFSAQGIINFLFEGPMADMIGYDGVYFVGATASVADMVSMRVGIHHYCNHYGDALIKRINPELFPRFGSSYKYVRMDGLVFGLSVEPVRDMVRIYGELNWLPKNVSSWRPIIFRPSWLDISKKDEYHTEYPDEYKARIVNVGLELSYPIFKSLGKTTLAYDLHMYEEGKIVYKDENGYFDSADKIHYDADRPWILEHGIVLSQQVGRNASFEIGYHYGRSPFNAMYYIDDASWIYVGATFNPDVTVTLFDTAE